MQKIRGTNMILPVKPATRIQIGKKLRKWSYYKERISKYLDVINKKRQMFSRMEGGNHQLSQNTCLSKSIP